MTKKVQASPSTKNGSLENFEDILERLGGFGIFQAFVLSALLFFEIPIAFTQFLQVFVGVFPKTWTCGNETREIAGDKFEMCTCNETLTLDSSTIVGEWFLVCEQAWVSDFLTSIQMAGMILGNIFGAQLADWYGRRYSFLASISVACTGSIISAVAPNPYVYAIGRFLCGASFSWYMCVTAIYSMEFMPTKWRLLCNSFGPFAEGTMLLGLLGYLIRPWRTLTWVTTVPYLLVLVVFPFVPESPRWLMQQKKLPEMDKVLRYIAKVNRTEPIPYEMLEVILQNEGQGQSEPQLNTGSTNSISISTITVEAPEGQKVITFDKVKKSSYLDLFKTATIRRTTICLMLIWFTWAISYFGVTYNVKNMAGSAYMNIFYLGVADRIGFLAALFICNRLGRCHSLVLFMSFSALFYVILAVLLLVMPNMINEPHAWLIGLFCVVGKLGLAGARSATRTLTGESYPTNIRTMGIGMSGISASFGGALSPQLAYLGTKWPSLPYFAFAAITVSGSLSSFLMTETKGKPMQEATTTLRKRLSNAVRRVSVSSIIQTMSRK